jgi:hypothetical protein
MRHTQMKKLAATRLDLRLSFHQSRNDAYGGLSLQGKGRLVHARTFGGQRRFG